MEEIRDGDWLVTKEEPYISFGYKGCHGQKNYRSNMVVWISSRKSELKKVSEVLNVPITTQFNGRYAYYFVRCSFDSVLLHLKESNRTTVKSWR